MEASKIEGGDSDRRLDPSSSGVRGFMFQDTTVSLGWDGGGCTQLQPDSIQPHYVSNSNPNRELARAVQGGSTGKARAMGACTPRVLVVKGPVLRRSRRGGRHADFSCLP